MRAALAFEHKNEDGKKTFKPDERLTSISEVVALRSTIVWTSQSFKQFFFSSLVELCADRKG